MAEGPNSAPPGAEELEKFHQNADTDTRKESIHHTLGGRSTQASPGDHNHRGADGSARLFEGITVSGSRGGNVALNSVIQALVQLGLIDNSTP
jgi:hypothetical protein